MPRNLSHLDIAVLLDQLDSWRNQQMVPPSRRASVICSLQDWLGRAAPQAAAPKQ